MNSSLYKFVSLFAPASRLAMLFALAVACGCGDSLPARVPVSGTVTIDGEPVPGAFVTFYPSEGRSSRGTADESGTFTLSCYETGDGALVGTHAVTVTAVDQTNPNKQIWLVPEKYGTADESGLTVDVNEPMDNVTLELTWEGEKQVTATTQGD